jgi:gamma-glutamylcyclotransferase (GGCT)/AIG2-like uncharacterized protein YtfP
MNLFVYGTLMYANVMASVIGRIPDKKIVLLSNHDRFYVLGAGFPSIIPNDGTGHVKGLLLKGITEAELKRLDRYEGFPNLYIRKAVVVRDWLLPNKSYSAQTYELTNKDNISREVWEPRDEN